MKMTLLLLAVVLVIYVKFIVHRVQFFTLPDGKMRMCKACRQWQQLDELGVTWAPVGHIRKPSCACHLRAD